MIRRCMFEILPELHNRSKFAWSSEKKILALYLDPNWICQYCQYAKKSLLRRVVCCLKRYEKIKTCSRVGSRLISSFVKTLVIVPTFNEKENIARLISEILLQLPQTHILIVDDSSPDGTGGIVHEITLKDSRVHLLTRKKKEGLGRAYVAGFKWGLSRDYEYFFEMDADFSHRPGDLVRLVAEAKNWDFIVGSRYVPGGGTVNWSFFRKLISVAGSRYSRWVLGYPLVDWTGGFNGWSERVLRAIEVDAIISNGYAFQIEMKYRASIKGFRGKEVPITFDDRRFGQSKMSWRIVVEAFFKIWRIRKIAI